MLKPRNKMWYYELDSSRMNYKQIESHYECSLQLEK